MCAAASMPDRPAPMIRTSRCVASLTVMESCCRTSGLAAIARGTPVDLQQLPDLARRGVHQVGDLGQHADVGEEILQQLARLGSVEIQLVDDLARDAVLL